MAAPGIANDTDGASLADPEYLSILPVNRRTAGSPPGLLILRGMGRKAQALRPELKIVAGRMFRPGARELIVGIAIQPEFRELEVGDQVIMQDGQWPIVGSFTTGGDMLEGQIIGDADTLMSAAKRNNFNSVIVRLGGPGSLETLQRALAANPSAGGAGGTPIGILRTHLAGYRRLLPRRGFAVGGIMALGALFGALNTMYSAVGARTQEIGTLRALGFGGTAVAVSVIAETMLLALAGALIGIGLAWALFNGQGYAFGEVLFHLTVSPALVGAGFGWALSVALLGGTLPAIRAARLRVVDALRAG